MPQTQIAVSYKAKRVAVILVCLAFLASAHTDVAVAQPAGASDICIVWEVKNRFRLFRDEADFLRQVAASRGDGVLAAERLLARERDGFGWVKDVVANLCSDAAENLFESLRARRRARELPCSKRSSGRRGAIGHSVAGRHLRLDLRRRRWSAAADQCAVRGGD